MFTLSLSSEREPRPVVKTPGYDGGAQVSPDGRWMTYVSTESGQFEVYVRPYPEPDRKLLVSTQGGTHPKWNPNGKELFYRTGNKMMVVAVSTRGADIILSQPRVLFEHRYAFGTAQTIANYDVSRDGQRFVMVKDDSASGRFNIVLNWQEELSSACPRAASTREWEALERAWQPRMRPTDECPRAGALHLAQAQSNEGPRGRKRGFPDAERLVKRFAAVPGLGVDSAHQIITEVGPTAATFPTAKRLASWVGACPGRDESAGINHSHRAPNGNRQMRWLLNQAANAAVKAKGSIFELVYRRLVVRLGHAQAIGAIAHRLCRLVWKILHDGVTYVERGPAVTKHRAQRRAAKMIRELRALGYRVEPAPPPASAPA